MQRLSSTSAQQRIEPQTVVDAVAAVVPFAAECYSEIPEIPVGYWDRKDLARVFGKHQDTIHTWEQNGWIKSIRKPSGRIIGYPADQIAAVAARTFLRFPSASFSAEEAAKLRLLPLLQWIHEAVRTAGTVNDAGKEALLDALDFAALAETTEVLRSAHNVTDADLLDHRPAALGQLRARLQDPHARHLLLRAWRQGGVILRIKKAKSIQEHNQ